MHLTRRVVHHLRRHVQHLLEDRRFIPGIAQTFGRIGLAQIGEQLADFAQRGDIGLTHAERDAVFGAE